MVKPVAKLSRKTENKVQGAVGCGSCDIFDILRYLNDGNLNGFVTGIAVLLTGSGRSNTFKIASWPADMDTLDPKAEMSGVGIMW